MLRTLALSLVLLAALPCPGQPPTPPVWPTSQSSLVIRYPGGQAVVTWNQRGEWNGLDSDKSTLWRWYNCGAVVASVYRDGRYQEFAVESIAPGPVVTLRPLPILGGRFGPTERLTVSAN